MSKNNLQIVYNDIQMWVLRKKLV